MQTTGSINITSQPTGSSISINHFDNGTTPVEIKDWPSGNYSIDAKMEGYINKAMVFTLQPGTNQPLDLVMTPIASPVNMKYATIGNLNSGTTQNIVYYGNTKTGTNGVNIDRMQVTIGKTIKELPDPLYLDGASLSLAGNSKFIELVPDTPLFNQGVDPVPGKWRIIDEVNTGPENSLEQNTQVVIAAKLRPEQVIPPTDNVSIVIKPTRGAAVALQFQ